MNKKIEGSENIKSDKINAIIDEHITNLDFHSNINNLIIMNLSNRKTLNYNRTKIIDKIIESQYVKDKENEIMDELYKSYKIELSNKEKEALLVKEGRKNLRINYKKTSIRDSIVSKVNNIALDNNNSNNLDSVKLFNILLEEFLNCDDKIKIENYLGDITNFDDQIILESQYLPDIIKKVGLFMEYITSSEYSNDIFLIPNLISFFTKFSKKCSLSYLIDITIIFLKYLNFIIDKFYKVNFDITKFYKISFNIECLINLILNLYNLKDQPLNIEEEKLNLFVNKFFSCILMNYENQQNIEFGISTNYILLLFLLFDPDFLALKIMLRFSFLRRYIIKKFSHTIESLSFNDSQSFINSCGKKYCFLWKHFSILEQIFPDKKISKKFLILSWANIKIHFLGCIFRYKPLRAKLYTQKSSCFNHFKNLMDYLIDVLFKTGSIHEEMGEFEEDQIESLFYLIKEVLCDCIIYCEDYECLTKKFKHLNELYMDKKYKPNKQFKYLLDDLVLALKNNFYSPVSDS